MKRTAQHLAVVAAVLVVVLAAGCRKKSPATQADLPPVPPVPAASSPAPQTAPAAAEPGADPWSGDLDAVNAYARERGLLGDVYFDYDRAELRADARERLAANARFLQDHPEFVVAIEGHCDERGTAEYNLALGQRRAYSAREYVGSLGVGDGRLRTVSFGKERPVCGASAEDCWWRNRRAAFVVVARGVEGS